VAKESAFSIVVEENAAWSGGGGGDSNECGHSERSEESCIPAKTARFFAALRMTETMRSE
jgi:hypothetical protein